jgi:hypothetical protein
MIFDLEIYSNVFSFIFFSILMRYLSCLKNCLSLSTLIFISNPINIISYLNILISKSLYSEAQYVKSQAINQTSAYLMINNFNAKIVDFDGNPLNLVFNDYEEMKKYIDQNEDGIITKVELNEEDQEKLEHLIELLEDLDDVQNVYTNQA